MSSKVSKLEANRIYGKQAISSAYGKTHDGNGEPLIINSVDVVSAYPKTLVHKSAPCAGRHCAECTA